MREEDEDVDVTGMPDGFDKETTLIRKEMRMKKDQSRIGKVGPVKTFFALIKGYCAIIVLILPKSFANGGYLISPIVLLLSSFLTTLCAIKLVESGLKTNTICYSSIGKIALGSSGKNLIDIMLALT